jgi:hypothetical protein
MSPDVVAILIAVALFILLIFSGYFYEKKRWNNGICPQTGKPWECFDVDSQGGRGYKSGDFSIWISFPGLDRVRAIKKLNRYQLLRRK